MGEAVNDGRELPAWDVWKASDRWAVFVACEIAARDDQIEAHQRQTEVRTVDDETETAAPRATWKVREAGRIFVDAYKAQADAEMDQTRVGVEQTRAALNDGMSQTAAEKTAKQHPDYIAAKRMVIAATCDKMTAFNNWACAFIEAGAAHFVPMMPTSGEDR
jgi:hypothetical protein